MLCGDYRKVNRENWTPVFRVKTDIGKNEQKKKTEIMTGTANKLNNQTRLQERNG